jgi:hypothetical protein
LANKTNRAIELYYDYVAAKTLHVRPYFGNISFVFLPVGEGAGKGRLAI